MSVLFKLPPEIRQKVYQHCLVVGKVFPYTLGETYDEYDCDYDDDLTARELAGYEAPAVALLRACKAIYSEAEPLLYKQNTFVLPASDLTARFFDRSLHNDTRRAWVTSVELGFEASDMTRGDREATLDKQLEIVRDDMLFPERVESPAWLDDSIEDWAHNMHEAYNVRLSSIVWPRKASFVLDHLHLREIVVDFRAARCIEDCCGMRFPALEAMRAGFVTELPKTLKLVGLGGATEAAVKIVGLWTAMRLSEWSFGWYAENVEEMDSLVNFIESELPYYER